MYKDRHEDRHGHGCKRVRKKRVVDAKHRETKDLCLEQDLEQCI